MKFKDWFKKNVEEKQLPKIETLKNKKINESFVECGTCEGSGIDPNNEDRNCPDCNGDGGYDDGNEGWYNNDDEQYQRQQRKEKKPKVGKNFKVGDVLVLTDDKKSSKMPQDAYDFLMTYKTFTVKSINDKGKINIGCRISKNENGIGVEKIYMFSTDRFDLLNPATLLEEK